MHLTKLYRLREWSRGVDASNLLEELSKTHPRKTVVALPDFFIDRLVILEEDMKSFAKKLQEVARRGGGVLHAGSQRVIRGGNASNFASAIASLGVRVILAVYAGELGEILLRYFMKNLPVDIHVIRVERDCLTVAFEVRYGRGRSNVMIGYRGSLAEAKPEDFNTIMSKAALADVVGFFNWTAMERGTELAEYVLEEARRLGKITYMDPSDVTVRSLEEVRELINRVISCGLLDVISLNENEALWVSRAIGIETGRGLKNALYAAYRMSKVAPVRVDLHTSLFSASALDGEVTIVPCFKVDVKLATGAGDAWNAGNVFGDLIGLTPTSRLLLANAVAASYISRGGRHPTLSDVSRFIAECCEDTGMQKSIGGRL